MSNSASCKLPRPTRFLPPCGGRSLLEGGALPNRHCAPRVHAWARPGFLLLSCHRRGCIVDASRLNRRRGLSRRFNSRCPRTRSPTGERDSNPFAVVVPEYRARSNRTTGASLLVAPTDPGLCRDSSNSKNGRRGSNPFDSDVWSDDDGNSSPPYSRLRRSLRKEAPCL